MLLFEYYFMSYYQVASRFAATENLGNNRQILLLILSKFNGIN